MQEKGNSSVVRSLLPGRHLGCSLGLAGSRGLSPLGTITFDRPATRTNWPLVLAAPLGSAGLRYVNIRQITWRERNPALVNKNQVMPELSLWRRKHCSLVSFTEQGLCPDPDDTRDPSSGHQNLGTMLWPRLNHHSWLCSCILMLCTYCRILGYISYSELKLLSISDQFLLIWKSWTLNSCCLTSWNINIRLERCPWLDALNIRKSMHQTVLFFQDHLWQYCPVIMS